MYVCAHAQTHTLTHTQSTATRTEGKVISLNHIVVLWCCWKSVFMLLFPSLTFPPMLSSIPHSEYQWQVSYWKMSFIHFHRDSCSHTQKETNTYARAHTHTHTQISETFTMTLHSLQSACSWHQYNRQKSQSKQHKAVNNYAAIFTSGREDGIFWWPSFVCNDSHRQAQNLNKHFLGWWRSVDVHQHIYNT